MATATLRAFRDQQAGEVDIETAPLGMLLVIGVGDAYDVGVGDRSIGPCGRRVRSSAPSPALGRQP